jgi:putative oxidoreductase
MKAISLLLLRLSTGIYLMLWGFIKLGAKDKAVGVSDKYYDGLLSGDLVNYSVGTAEMLIGLLVVLGLFRGVAYVGQLTFYLVGAAAIITSLLDPFGLYLADAARLTFFPSWTLLFASVVLIAFKSDDTLSLDSKRGN